jgi:hypothetical protein
MPRWYAHNRRMMTSVLTDHVAKFTYIPRGELTIDIENKTRLRGFLHGVYLCREIFKGVYSLERKLSCIGKGIPKL